MIALIIKRLHEDYNPLILWAYDLIIQPFIYDECTVGNGDFA